MENKIDFSNTRFILFSDNYILNLCDAMYEEENFDIEKCINENKATHGSIKKASYFMLKIFDVILGGREGRFDNIGETNWSNLIKLHKAYPIFYAYIITSDNKKELVGTSVDGIIWNLNVIDT